MATGTSNVERLTAQCARCYSDAMVLTLSERIKQSLRTLFNRAHIAIDAASDCSDQLDVVINAVCDLQISCHHHLHLFLSE